MGHILRPAFAGMITPDLRKAYFSTWAEKEQPMDLKEAIENKQAQIERLESLSKDLKRLRKLEEELSILTEAEQMLAESTPVLKRGRKKRKVVEMNEEENAALQARMDAVSGGTLNSPTGPVQD